MNDNVSSEQKENIPQTEEQLEKRTPTFKIYTFFKGEPAIAITCISALVVVVSYLINVAVFLRESSFLQYWNIDSVYVAMSTPNRVYMVCGYVIYSLSVLIMISLINGAYEAFIPAKRVSIALKEVTKSNKRNASKLNKRKNAPANMMRNKRRKTSTRIKADSQERRELDKITKIAIEKAAKASEMAKEIIKSIRMDYVLHLVIAALVLACGSTVLSLLGGTTLRIWAGLLINALMLIIEFFVCIIIHRNDVGKKKIKKSAYENLNKYVDDFNKTDHNYPLFRKWDSVFSDSAIKSTLVAMVVYVVLLLLSFSSLGNTEAARMTKYSVVFSENQTYAIVYNNGEKMILEECIISDGSGQVNEWDNNISPPLSVEIDTDAQKIIVGDEIDYRVIEFENVTRKEDKGKLSFWEQLPIWLDMFTEFIQQISSEE